MNRIFLVGESNPYGGDPRYALYPLPPHATGGRLARVLGMSAGEYLDAFERRNLLAGAGWSAPAARQAASRVEREFREAAGAALVLLGARVAAAFGLSFQHAYLCSGLTTSAGSRVLVVPHPSGRSRMWNDPELPGRVRAAVDELRGAPAGGGREPRPATSTPADLTPYDAAEVAKFREWLPVEHRRRGGEDVAVLDPLELAIYPEGVGRGGA